MPSPSLGDLLDSGIEPGSPALQADSLPSEPPAVALEAVITLLMCVVPFSKMVPTCRWRQAAL